MVTMLEREVIKQKKSAFPFLFTNEKVKDKESSKLDVFEKGLENEICKADTVEMAVEKMVKMALLAEFGAGLLTSTGSRGMIDTITYGILHDEELRKQSLLIIDRFAK
ncbi:MAG: hypothetical protein HQ564_05885 [Candidatus Saganbacteria bacterium]|nr:hypothetical protein [Candidatus Saganbacteria bacterium]